MGSQFGDLGSSYHGLDGKHVVGNDVSDVRDSVRIGFPQLCLNQMAANPTVAFDTSLGTNEKKIARSGFSEMGVSRISDIQMMGNSGEHLVTHFGTYEKKLVGIHVPEGGVCLVNGNQMTDCLAVDLSVPLAKDFHSNGRKNTDMETEYRRIDNAGIREGASGAGGADMSLFEPGRLLEYIKELALFPLGGWEQLDVEIAKAQLMSFYRSKGYLELPAYHLHIGLVENDADFLPVRKPSKDTGVLAKKLLKYIKKLALFPLGGRKRLELKIAKAQLRSFYRSKGYLKLPAYHLHRGLAENDADFFPVRKPSKDTVELAKVLKYIKKLAVHPLDGEKRHELVTKAQLISMYRSKDYLELPAYHERGGVVENDEDFSPGRKPSKDTEDTMLSELLEHIKELAVHPLGGGERHELVTKAQLISLYRSKDYLELPAYHVRGGLVENDEGFSAGRRPFKDTVLAEPLEFIEERHELVTKGQLISLHRSKDYLELPAYHVRGGFVENDADFSPGRKPFKDTVELAELLEYIKELALFPLGGGERLELVIAKAQLISFYRSQGCLELPAYHVRGGSVNNEDFSPGRKPFKDTGDTVELAEFLEYIKELALFPLRGGEQLELVVAKAQLISFYRSKGYLKLPAYHACGGLVENDEDFSPEIKPFKDTVKLAAPISIDVDKGSGEEKVKSQERSSHKWNQIFERKPKGMAEMSGKKTSNLVNGKATGKSGTRPSGKKRKAVDSFSDDSFQKRRKWFPLSIDTDPKAPSAKRSFMVGDCIHGIAGQVTGSHPILKFSGEKFQNNAVTADLERDKAVHISGPHYSLKKNQKRRIWIPEEYSSSDELLSQLCLAAQDPLNGYNFLSVIVSFFSDFRNSIHQENLSSVKKISSGKSGGKSSNSQIGSVESFALNDMKDKISGSSHSPKENQERRIGIPMECSPNELLSQLCMAAQDPLNGYNFLSVIVSFFSDFRNSICQENSSSVKKISSGVSGGGKSSNSKIGSVESFDLNDMKDNISGSSHSPKDNLERRVGIPMEWSPDKILSQLCWAALDPLKGYSFQSVIVSFFSDFRNSIYQENSSSGKNISSGKIGIGESSNSKISFDDIQDSCWTDRIMHGSTEEEPSHKSHKRKGESQLERPKKKERAATKQSKSLQSSPKLDSDLKPQVNVDVNGEEEFSPTALILNFNSAESQLEWPKRKEIAAIKQSEALQSIPKLDSDQKAQVNEDVNGEEECSPTALILNFNSADSVPSDTDLSKIFSQYGALKESEGMRKSKRAKVVFSRRSDAEVAFSSAGKFSIFGGALVSYRLRHLSSKTKATRRATTRLKKDATSMEGNHLIPTLPGKDASGKTTDGLEVPAQRRLKKNVSFKEKYLSVES